MCLPSPTTAEALRPSKVVALRTPASASMTSCAMATPGFTIASARAKTSAKGCAVSLTRIVVYAIASKIPLPHTSVAEKA